MTAKEFVKSKIPNAHSERHAHDMIKGLQEVYWLIRDGRSSGYMAIGKSESNAWLNAKNFILKNENDKK